MASGRNEQDALRNARIHWLASEGLSHGQIAAVFGLARQVVARIVADPDAYRITLKRAAVRFGAPGRPLGPITHGSASGYRACRKRAQGACQPCKDANAEAQRIYQASRR